MEKTKLCSKCKNEQQLSEYYGQKSQKDGLKTHCKSCCKQYQQQYYKNNPDKIRIWERTKNRSLKERGLRVIDWLITKYGGIPCMDCKLVFSWECMDFDHRPDEVKWFTIGQMGGRKARPGNINKVLKEIEKCDLVCACCHRTRTKERWSCCSS